MLTSNLTEEMSGNASGKEPGKGSDSDSEKEPKRIRSVYGRLLRFSLFSAALATSVLVLIVTTTVGAKFALDLLGHFAGFRTAGVSGNLIRQLTIQRIEFHHEEVELVADHVELNWQPTALLQRRIQLSYLRIENLQLIVAKSKDSNKSSWDMPKSLKLPSFINLLVADQLAVDHLHLSMPDADHQFGEPLHFSALKAGLLVDASLYQLQFSGTSPWGAAALNGEVETTSPFKTHAQFNWHGVTVNSAIEESDITVPAAQINGSLTGSWKQLLVDAHLNIASNSSMIEAETIETKKGNGQITSHRSPQKSIVNLKKIKDTSIDPVIRPAAGFFRAVLTPFEPLPLQSVHVDFDSLNPTSFYAAAPKADLRFKADLKATENRKNPTLSGIFSVQNRLPMSWDSGGIPVSSLSSEVMVTEQKMDWKNMKLEFGDGGSATGSGQLDLDRNAQDEPATLYDRLTGLSTIFEVKRLNLLRIDSRLKPTELNGQIQAAGVNTGLEISLNLKDSRRDNLNGKLEAQVHVNPEEVVSLKKIELRAKDAVLTAQGSFSLRNKQVFNLQGEAKNLNPALWIDVPEGHIGTRFNIKGQLKQGWLVDAQITDFSGQFAGLNLHGESNIVAEQDKSVSVKNCEFKWGKNHIYAKGYWPLAVLTSSPQQNQLHFSVALPDLGEFSKPFKKIMPSAIQENFHGALFIDGILSGNAKQPGGHLTVKASNLSVPGIVGFDKLQAAIDLESGKQGKISGNLDASELSIGSLLESPGASSEPSMKREYEGLKFSRVKVNLSGLRHAHQLSLNADWLHKYQIALQAKGELQESGPSLDNAARWRGSVEQLDLTGPSDLKLVSPFSLQISENSTEMGAANWQGKLGKLQIQQMLWSHNRLKTKGQLQNLSVVNLHKLWRAKLPLMGNLQLYAGWDLDIGQKQAEGQFDVRRESGDLIVQDVSSGLSQIFALGLQKLLVTAKLGHTPVSESDINKKVFSLLRQPVDVQVHVQGSQLGSIDGHVSTSANKTAQGWDVNAPLSGAASMHLNDIQWLSQLVGSGAADVALRGEVELNAQLAGTIQNPTYLAKISGKEVQVTLAELGVLLPHGVLKASIEESSGKTKFTLDKLRFSHAIKLPAMAGAKHDELAKLPWLEEKGFIEASGEIDLQSGHGAIAAHWQRFPFLQDSNHWLVASGDAQLTQTEKAWQLTGQLSADAAYFSMPKEAPPKLSSDVVVLKKKDRTQAKSINQANLKSSVDFIIKTGNNFVFVGRGLDTRLTGQLRVRLQDDDPMFVTGLIQTSGGTYEGYGQQLAIERGNLNFQGAPDNPSLNVRALRRGLRVEAGVEVIGTVAKPEVRLISEPEVPDQDKLSWMMLGRSSDQMAGSEASLLMSAASAIFGGDSGSDVPRELARTFGLDDISIGTSTGSRESQLPSQTVAGNISNVTSNEQIFSIGKRLSPNLVFSIERSLTDATNGITLTWNLTRRFSIVGRAGNDTSIDGQYMFSFN